jgi:hypothetical protein
MADVTTGDHSLDRASNGATASSPVLESDPSPVSIRLAYIGVGLLVTTIVGLWSALLETWLLLPPVYLVLSILASRNPRFPVYLLLSVMTFIKFFQIPDFTIYSTVIGQSFRFANSGSPLVKFADELVLVLVVQHIVLKTHLFTKTPILLRQLRLGRYVGYVFAVAVLSAIVNIVPLDNILYFSANWLRPYIVLACILVVPWTRQQIRFLCGYTITLAFVFQLAGSVAVNLPHIQAGEWFWIDDFTGTFMFPLCEWAAFLLAVALIVFLAEFTVRRRPQFILLAGLSLFGIISAQVGTMTVVLFIAIAIYFLTVLLIPQIFGLSVITSRLSLVAGLFFTVLAILGIWSIAEQDAAESFAVNYAVHKLHQRVLDVMSLKEIPKVLAYINVGSALSTGEINPILGAGPAMYLTNTGQALGRSPIAAEYSASAMFAGEATGQSESQVISVVGLVGELGIVGLIAYMLLLLSPFRFLWRRRQYLFSTTWHGLFIGVIGVLVFLLMYAFIQAPFDGWIEVLYSVILCGSLIIVSEMRRQDMEYEPFYSA